MKKRWNIVLAILVLPIAAWAADRPGAQDTRTVVHYYFNGQGQGAVLMDYRVCSEVAPEGEDKHECRRQLDAAAIPLGEEAFLWMNFLVPAEDQADILISYARNERVRKTADVTLKGAIRFRTWKRIPTDKPGKWAVTIVQEMPDQDQSTA